MRGYRDEQDTEAHLIMECWHGLGLSVLVKDNGRKINDMRKIMSGAKRVNRDQMFQYKDGSLVSIRHPARAQLAGDWRKQDMQVSCGTPCRRMLWILNDRKAQGGWGKLKEKFQWWIGNTKVLLLTWMFPELQATGSIVEYTTYPQACPYIRSVLTTIPQPLLEMRHWDGFSCFLLWFIHFSSASLHWVLCDL